MRQGFTPVISSREIAPGCYLMWLEAPELAAESRPGQFVMVHCGEDTMLRRPLSIHQRDSGNIALLFQVVGKGTAWLSQLGAGDNIDLLGPLGNGFSIPPDASKLLLVAGGIGIAPLYFLAQEASREGYSIRLIMGAQNAVELYLNQLPPIRGTIILVTEDGVRGEKGLATDITPSHIDWADQIFACGPPGMYRTMAQMPELQDKPIQVSLEVMMGCGVGVCYGCTVITGRGPRQVCQDGPVFDIKDILCDSL
ncbi:dihydroorotate dehydrogenase electron transfer subunit [Chloroflexota bacterium]